MSQKDYKDILDEAESKKHEKSESKATEKNKGKHTDSEDKKAERKLREKLNK